MLSCGVLCVCYVGVGGVPSECTVWAVLAKTARMELDELRVLRTVFLCFCLSCVSCVCVSLFQPLPFDVISLDGGLEIKNA